MSVHDPAVNQAKKRKCCIDHKRVCGNHTIIAYGVSPHRNGRMDQNRKPCCCHRIVYRLQLFIIHLQISISGKQHHTFHPKILDVRYLFYCLCRIMPRKQSDSKKASIAVISNFLCFLVQFYAKLSGFIRRQKAGIRDVRTDQGNIHLPFIHRF